MKNFVGKPEAKRLEGGGENSGVDKRILVK